MHRIQQPRVTTSIGVKKHFRIPSRCIFDVEKKQEKKKFSTKLFCGLMANLKKKKKDRERERKRRFEANKKGIYIYECRLLGGKLHAKGIAAEVKPNRPAAKSRNWIPRTRWSQFT